MTARPFSFLVSRAPRLRRPHPKDTAEVPISTSARTGGKISRFETGRA
jgi:hypothetical protein